MSTTSDPPPVRVGPVEIRRARTIPEYEACQQAQRKAWGVVDEGYLIPIATMVGANLHGGLVLGAFQADGQALGMSFAFLGIIDAAPCLYSQLTGIVPEAQARGLGHAMKVYQAQVARQQGLELIAWAFDPLQQGNAHFNLRRLGATCRRYIDNMYGPRTDSLNANAPTDRLIAEWNLIHSGAGASPSGPHPRLIRNLHDPSFDGSARLLDNTAAIDIPPDIQRLRSETPTLAEQWRQAVAQAFHAAFTADFAAVDFVREPSHNPPRTYYVLKRRVPDPLAPEADPLSPGHP